MLTLAVTEKQVFRPLRLFAFPSSATGGGPAQSYRPRLLRNMYLLSKEMFYRFLKYYYQDYTIYAKI